MHRLDAPRTLLRSGKDIVRATLHHAVSIGRGGRGVPFELDPGWIVNVAPQTYDDLRYWSTYERQTFETLKRIWKPDASIIDIGAHYGSFSVACLRNGGHDIRLLSVEPSPPALAALTKNRHVNRRVHWTIHPGALSDAAGSVTLHFGLQNMLTPDARAHGTDSAGSIEVRTTTLDSLVETERVQPQIIKLDVEGFELEVLRGAGGTLERWHPVFLLEWHLRILRERGLDPVAALAPLVERGYSWIAYEMGDGEVEPAGLMNNDIVRLLCLPPGRDE